MQQPTQNNNESNGVLYSENPSMFRNNPLGFILCIITIPLVIPLFILIKWYIDCISSKLTISDTEILYETGLLSKNRSEINISSIRTVKVHQSMFNRIFGTGKIEIYTAGDSPEIVATGFPDPDKIRDLIKMGQD